MATLTSPAALDPQALQALFTLLPVSGDSGAAALSSSQRFGAFAAGQSVIVAATGNFHVKAGTGSVTATTSDPIFPAGVYKMVLPDSCTHVAMIQASGATASGQVYRG